MKMMVKYRLVIWDWNGTLLDDAAVCIEIINSILRSRGMAWLSPERYQEIFDFPVENYYKILGFDFEHEPFAIIADEFIEGYRKHCNRAKLREGAKDALIQLNAAGYRQIILSASKKEMLVEQVAGYGISQYFSEILGIDNHYAAGKLEMAEDWLAGSDIKPQEAVLIGDTMHDAEVAEALGCDCILIPGGHQNRARIQTVAPLVADDLADAVEHVLQVRKKE